MNCVCLGPFMVCGRRSRNNRLYLTDRTAEVII